MFSLANILQVAVVICRVIFLHFFSVLGGSSAISYLLLLI